MANYRLDDPIIYFGNNQSVKNWTFRHAFEGVQIFGGIGSGKTSGSGRALALKYLMNGFGGLVLTVKRDEVDLWREYCAEVGRSADFITLEPNGANRFNFLDYESSATSDGETITENIVEVLNTVIKASQEKEGGGSGGDSAFWGNALDMLMFNVIDLCKLAYDKLTVQQLYDIALSLPKPSDKNKTEEEKAKSNAFKTAHEIAFSKVNRKLKEWHGGLSESYKKSLDKDKIEAAFLKAVPEARLFNSLNQFFFDTLKNLNEKTRSIIDFMFSGFLFRFLREPIYSMFCEGNSTIVPEDCLRGKIIVLNIPVKIYNKVGRDCQILFKYIWQRRMEKRLIANNNTPVFLWADEAQNFLHEHDPDYQATARSSRISTVYLTQNLPNYNANMGGSSQEYKVKSFLGTLGTKIFHANADIDTNKYASELVGEEYIVKKQRGSALGEKMQMSVNQSEELVKIIRPEKFVGFRNGGEPNNFIVKGLVHVQGTPIFDGLNYEVVSFIQDNKQKHKH